MLKVKGAEDVVGVAEAAFESSAERRVRVSSWVVRKSCVGLVETSIWGWRDKRLEGANGREEGMVDS